MTDSSFRYACALCEGGLVTEADGNKDKSLDAYISLYKQQMDRFNNTQDVEWKANFGIWALLAGAIYFAAQKSVTVPKGWVVLVLCCAVVVHYVWLRLIHDSQQLDKDLFSLYRRRAAQILECEKEQEDLLSRSKWYRKPWVRVRELVWTCLEVGMTGLLCLLLFVMLFKTQQCPDAPGQPNQIIDMRR
jgi:hypothetical protein